eukprot:m.160568 g.160568  ORF g.160568 m.160568 type:complete len:457 (+) comp16363_c4_seq4:1438-2808(+)
MADAETFEDSVDVEVLEGSVDDENVELVAQEGPVDVQADEDVNDTLRWSMETDYQKRTSLPVPHNHAAKDASMWSVLKKNAGKRLSQVSMPVTFNEPLSALQRLCEELEYSHLLDQASIADSPQQRLLLIGAFAVSMYGSTAYRSGRKPFNPILGETFDGAFPERGFRFMAEQVSHHPPISVGLAESKHWTLYQEAGAKTSLRPSSLKILPQGFLRLQLTQHGETYEWKKTGSSVEDIISGNKWVDHIGKMIITNLNTGDVCIVEFTPYSMMRKKKKFDVKGQVFTVANPKTPAASFSGKWTTEIACDQTGEVLWKNEEPSKGAMMHGFGFSSFACQLNELPPPETDVHKRMLPSDSRFRPDQRMLENAQFDAAAEEKRRVEQLQREARQQREAKGVTYVPRFFRFCAVPVQRPHQTVPIAKSKGPEESIRREWVYVGGYWRMKATGAAPPIDPLW